MRETDLAAQRCAEAGGAGGCCDTTVQDIRGIDATPVITRVLVFLRADDRALYRYSSEQPFAAAVSVNGCPGRDADVSIATNRAGGDAGIGAQGHVSTLRECAHGGVAIENENEIGRLRADLSSPTRTAHPDKGRPGPPVFRPRDHDAPAAFSAEDEARFDDRDNGESLRIS